MVIHEDIPKMCFDWCQQQYVDHVTNITLNYMFVPALVLIVLGLSAILRHFHEQLTLQNPEEYTTVYLESVNEFLQILAVMLLIGFFVLYFWFT